MQSHNEQDGMTFVLGGFSQEDRWLEDLATEEIAAHVAQKLMAGNWKGVDPAARRLIVNIYGQQYRVIDSKGAVEPT